MASEFESAQWVIAGRSVMITSWCDQATHTWSASAPTYCHLLAADAQAEARSPSRAVAVDRVVRELKASLERASQH